MAGLKETAAAMARLRRATSVQASMVGAMQGGRTAEAAALDSVGGFGANPGDLRMLAHAPPGLAQGAPLVVALHGCTQTAEGYAQGAGWISLADRLGFALVCPEQVAANNAQRCFNWFEPGDTARGEGEAASIRAMVAHATALYGCDRRRVFVTGLSAGGAMTAALLAAYPDVFAGGAIVAGLPAGAASGVQEALAAMFQGRSHSAQALGDRVRAASPHKGPWPRVSIWHGEADHTVLPSNLGESVKQWTDVHGLAGAKPEVETLGRDRRSRWPDASGRVMVESHAVAGLGHGVPLATSGPDGVGQAGPFLLEAGVSSSGEIAQFWGLADALTDARPAATASPGAGPRVAPKTEPAAARLGVEAMIQRALKAAGLMKVD